MILSEEMVQARIERLTRRDLRQWIRRGWVRPAQGVEGPVFDELDVARLRLICDLRKDMGLPSGAMPVVLSLLDQLHRSRREMRLLLAALDDQPEEIRLAIGRALQRHGSGDRGHEDA